MNVSAAGAGLPGLDPQALRVLTAALANMGAPLPGLIPSSPEDEVSPSLAELAAPPMQLLLHVVDAMVSQAVVLHAAPPQALYQTATASYGPDPVTLTARNSAEKFVAKAAHIIETAEGRTSRVPDNVDPRTVVALANQFIQTGQFPNYLRAAELGRMVVSWYGERSPATSAAHVPEPRRRAQDLLKTL
ncbi:MAG: hypothetical protein M3N54_15885, partial [Acidobacteriota bacterium]|nr:hypothetical protein [Acidobacteriota bacterium]